MSALLEISSLHKSFGGVSALRGVDLTLSEGEITGILGTNGAGKSTLFKVIAGFESPDSGKVLLDGAVVTRKLPHAVRRSGIALTFQQPLLASGITVANLLRTAISAAGLHADIEKATAQLAAEYGLTEHFESTFDQLDYGTLKLLDVARAVGTRPKVLLLDEGFAGQSDDQANLLTERLERLAAGGTSILMSEHVVGRLAVCQRIAFLDQGRIVIVGQRDDVLNDESVRGLYFGE